MSRILAALALTVAVLGGTVPLAVLPSRARLTIPAALVDGRGLEALPPHRGPSRDRALHGKARRHARRAALA